MSLISLDKNPSYKNLILIKIFQISDQAKGLEETVLFRLSRTLTSFRKFIYFIISIALILYICNYCVSSYVYKGLRIVDYSQISNLFISYLTLYLK